MATTIQISSKLQKALTDRKLFDKETYEEVIWSLIDDSEALSEETLKEIEYARAQIKAGNKHSLDDVKEALNV